MTGAVRRVLLSAAVHAQLAPRCSGLDGLQVVTLEEARAGDTRQVDAVYLSRDIHGQSTKTWLSDEVQAAYAVMRRSPSLQWVHTHSAGADRPIFNELRERGVRVSTSAGANAVPVAQTALAAVLAMARQLPAHWQARHERRWLPTALDAWPADLQGQVAVLVGWGPIARALQPWLTMLGLEVVVVRRSDVPAAPGIETLRFDGWHAVLPRTDWLLLACPLTHETRGLVGADALARLKPGARLVNVARGEVVDEAAMVAALQSGRLASAWLDVFTVEPLPADSPLWALPQVMISPHAAGHAAGNAARAHEIFVGNLARWWRGEPLVNDAS